MITTIRSSKPLLPSFFSSSSLQRSSSFSSPNFISFPSINNNNNHFSEYNNTHKRMLASTMSHASSLHPQLVQGQVGDSFLRNVLSSMEHIYLNRNPTAKAMLDLTTNHDNQSICYDHLAFRTFGVDGHGIESMSKLFFDFGYTQMEELTFPKKKLRALWFSPPPIPNGGSEGSGVYGPLPRIFISELLVHQMSRQAQVEEIHRRDGFEVGNADKIFESTSKDQLTRKA
ncbi:hypothetical protein CTI12_AA319230 [Artemisia annua]|uniref:2-oxoadipate dioxygenase/decarboxylase n=1 Tax=Artemisia annua TaxID=35608 RepID=A0A2U1N0S2_ARTAN|nr:hypothetical protein CTI12_AA319230 [Artemisia annua]